MRNLFIDIETYSSTDLTKSGVYKYAESEDFEILLFGYAFDNNPVTVVDIASGEILPNEVKEALNDCNVLKWAHNAAFERICISRFMGFPLGTYLNPSSWRCSMVLALYNGFPRSLADVGDVLKLDKKKLTEGKELIKYFCMPCKETKVNGGRTRNYYFHDKEKWNLFKYYNLRDVEAEIEIINKLIKFNAPDDVWNQYAISEEINDRGVLVSMDLVLNAIQMDEEIHQELTQEMQQITNLENPNSVSQQKEWLSKLGINVDTLGKKDVAEYSKIYKNTVVGKMMDLRKMLSKSSVKKYQAMVASACKDNRVRGMFMFYGARTGRWISRIVQLQNLPRNEISDLDNVRELVKKGDLLALRLLYDDVPTVLSNLIRTAFIAPKDEKYIVADFSAIEARVLAWLAGEQWRLDTFKANKDIYCASASQMFHLPVEKHGVNGHLRSKGKVAELACIAEGELVLTHRGLVPIEKILITDKLWDGFNWVSHEGVIFKGVKDIYEYEGLRATSDHQVFVVGYDRAVSFETAIKNGLHLIKTGVGRKEIRMDRNYIIDSTMPRKKPASQNGGWKVLKLSNCQMDKSRKSKIGEKQRLSKMLTTQACTKVVIQKTHCGKRKVFKSELQRIQKLWSERHNVQFCKYKRCLQIPDREIWYSKTRNGTRQNQYQWELRRRKSSVCNSCGKPSQSKNNCSIRISSGILALYPECYNKEIITRNDTLANYSKCPRECFEESKMLEAYRGKARLYDISNAGENHRFTVSNCLVHNCGYGGSIGALKAMGALDMGLSEDELQQIINKWREANPNIVAYWRKVDRAIKRVLTDEYKKSHQTVYVGKVGFKYQSGMLFILLPSGRRLTYVRPRIGVNRFGSESILYEGLDMTKKFSLIESYSAKFVENIVQAVARDLLMNSMTRLRNYRIVAHVHDELIIEVPMDMKLDFICKEMAIVPEWAEDLCLRADGFETFYYCKD